MSERIPVLYLAPWVGYGGSDTNTVDWFRWIDKERFAPYLIVTQPSPNPLLDQVEPHAEEVWVLPDLMPAEGMPSFICDFVRSRGIRLIHLMNSRIGFDLLPDLAALPQPPAVVVQMHAEEVDRSGYVRYVTTRYGDLVDCFSLSNAHVAEAVRGYGIPVERTRIIYTGADAGEFDPARAEPIAALPEDRLQILFAARLVAQKDPLLMVEVAAALREEGVPFQIQVVGEGDMEAQIEARVAALDLGEHVVLNPAVPGLKSWYAACDALLLTSTFEGIPVVLFEAMAMGLPIVAPGLPGIREMLHAEDEGVILPRDSVAGYVEALGRLGRDREHLAARSREMRGRAEGELSVQQMAASHGELYEELLAGRDEPGGAGPAAGVLFPVLSAAELEAGLAEGPLAAVSAAGASPLQGPELQEKALRRFHSAGAELDAIVLADAGEEGRFGFRLLPPDDGPADPTPHALIWRRGCEQRLPEGLWIDPEAPAASLARLLSGAGARLEWRHLPAPAGFEAKPCGPPQTWRQIAAELPAASEELPPLPGAGAWEAPRWQGLEPSWMPTHSRLLVRQGEAALSTEPPAPPARGHVLGALRNQPFQGTARLLARDGEYLALDPGEPVPDGATELGFVELAPLPGMDSVSRGIHRASGRTLLVGHPDDPLGAEVDVVEHLGFLDPVPQRPRGLPAAERPLGLVALAKSADLGARRHRYALGELPPGELVAELGALAESSLQGSTPVWIVDGYLLTDRHRPPRRRPGAAAARWVAEPLRWGELAPAPARAKAIARRAGESLASLARRPAAPDPAGDPAAWLFAAEQPGLQPLYASYHPVSGDQLLTHAPETAAALGYLETELLGHTRAVPLLTEGLGEREFPLPWARRFGAVPRCG